MGGGASSQGKKYKTVAVVADNCELRCLRPQDIPTMDVWLTTGPKHLARDTGRYYYEVTFDEYTERDLVYTWWLGQQNPQIGWLTLDFEESEHDGNGVGHDIHGWATDGVRNKQWHNGETEAAWPRKWQGNDVIGLAIDIEAGQMQFSLNGEWVPDAQMTIKERKEACFFPALSMRGWFVMHIPPSSWRFDPPAEDYQAWADFGSFGRPLQSAALVTARLEHRDFDSRFWALKEFSHLAEKGDSNAIASVAARLGDIKWDVRKAAVEALSVLAEKGDAKAIAGVEARLEDSDEDVRRAAVRALRVLVERGDVKANAGVTVCLEDSSGYVRKAAVEALTVLAEKGDANIIADLTACLEDSDEDVKQAAVRALSILAEKGSAKAIAGVTACLEDSSGFVRKASVEALSLLVEEGNAHAIASVKACLTDEKVEVRVAAADCLERLENMAVEHAVPFDPSGNILQNFVI